MDAQVFWDPLGTSSCWHGITSVVMGNCGFTLAPCAETDKHLVMRNLERAEDISGAAMEAGIDWSWTTFPEFLDTLELAAQGHQLLGLHRPLRAAHLRDGRARVRAGARPRTTCARWSASCATRDPAGAMGFTTSRSPSHETPDARPVASRMAAWDEVRRLVGVMGELNAGIFELAGEAVDRELGRPGPSATTTSGCATWPSRPAGRSPWAFQPPDAPDMWRHYLRLLDETAAAGGRMFAQVHSRASACCCRSRPRCRSTACRPGRSCARCRSAEQQRRLRDPELRAAAGRGHARARHAAALGTEAGRPPTSGSS